MSGLIAAFGIVMLAALHGVAGADGTTGQTERLWAAEAPMAQGAADEDVPTVTIFRPDASKATGASIVVCPGGGYGGLAGHEGRPIAEWLNSLGITGVVLKYRLGPKYHHPVMLTDVSRAIRYVRAHAEALKLDPARVGIIGFSAGGHLASTAATHFDEGDAKAVDVVDRMSSRPNVAILLYPVITMTTPFTHGGSRNNLLGPAPHQSLVDLMSNEKQVTAKTPPSFIVHTADDAVVPVENALLYTMACRKMNVPVELHVYEHGPHGIGLAAGDPILGTWTDLCAKWLARYGFLKR